MSRSRSTAFGRVLAIAAVLAGALSIPASPALAGVIQLAVSSRITVERAAIRVSLRLRNQGDEPARRVTSALEFRDVTVQGSGIVSLDPLSERSLEIEVPGGFDVLRGRWPVVVRIRYADVNGHEFEAIHVDIAQIGEAGDAGDFHVDVPEANVETRSEIHAALDPGRAGGVVRLTFLAPLGLIIAPEHHSVPAGSKRSSIPLTLINAGATLESRLPIVAIAEHDGPDGHQTVVSTSLVQIGPPPTPGVRRGVIVGLLAAFAATWVVVALIARRRRTRDDG